MTKFSLFILSLIIVAFGNAVFLPILSFAAAAFGYALLWRLLLFFPSKKTRFYLAFVWFSVVQAIQLSWMTSTEFQGNYILFCHAGISLWLGSQFGLLSLLIPRTKEQVKDMSLLHMLGIPSLWILMEWARLHILCGLSFNMSGMALAAYPISSQMASIWGVLGLSFWVLLVNVFFLKVLASLLAFPKKTALTWLCLALFPYLFGMGHIAYHKKINQNDSFLTVALVQTGLLPSEKMPLKDRFDEFIPPLLQWKRILSSLKEKHIEKWDLIVLPEGAVPFRFKDAVYPIDTVLKILFSVLGNEKEEWLPPLEEPYAENIEGIWKVSNAFWAQAISNHFKSEVIVGLDDKDTLKKNYNAAFRFTPLLKSLERYEKRVLVPLAEYLPFPWLKPFVSAYGISEFFTHGDKAKIFFGKIPLAVSICYEETFPNLIREGRNLGAKLFVNITNDNWCPNSKLSLQHFAHGKLRAIENGVPLLRACNTGVTAAVDSLGQVIVRIGTTYDAYERKRETLCAKVPMYEYKTLYMIWGDAGIAVPSFLIMFGFAGLSIVKKKFGRTSFARKKLV